MKLIKPILIAGMMLIGSWGHAGVYTQTFSPGTGVTAGNPIPTAFTGVFNAAPAGYTVSAITVGLNITGGYSGGFYMFLAGPNATLVTLLAAPGTSTTGTMNFTLSDAGAAITSATSLASGTYLAKQSLNTTFAGQTADSTWTIYFSDLSSGGGNPTLNSWTLGITAVPEPINVALAVFGLVFVGGGIGRHYLTRKSVSPIV